MMGVKTVINAVLCGMLVLLTSPSGLPGVYGTVVCTPTNIFASTQICSGDAYCCGEYNDQCCSFMIPSGSNEAMEAVFSFIILVAITCCCVCCYRCCCRRTTSRGFVYSTPGTTTAVSVTLPPQQQQQVPYPTVVPYPQQTPYPPQYNPPTNPYYGMPPPAYGVAVQSGNQQASAPYMG